MSDHSGDYDNSNFFRHYKMIEIMIFWEGILTVKVHGRVGSLIKLSLSEFLGPVGGFTLVGAQKPEQIILWQRHMKLYNPILVVTIIQIFCKCPSLKIPTLSGALGSQSNNERKSNDRGLGTLLFFSIPIFCIYYSFPLQSSRTWDFVNIFQEGNK